MKKIFIQILRTIIFAVIAILAGLSIAWAGSLSPTGSPAATMYTLSDIYYKLTANTSAGTHTVSTSTSPAASFKTLAEIYAAIPNGGGDPNTVGPFTNNSDGTYTDQHTLLMWQGSQSSAVEYSSAVSYCDALSLAGHSDWRLPTVKEWESVLDYSQFDSATTLSGVVGDVWTITSLAHDTTYAWIVRVYNGIIDSDLKSGSGTYQAQCVRP